MILFLGILIIATVVYAVFRQADVRLVLVIAGLSLGIITGNPWEIVSKFFVTFTASEYIIPISCAMGFAYVLRATQCDQHLIHLLVRPLRNVRPLLIPGAVIIGFLVNMPIVSQTSAVVAIGPVIIPLLLAAGISRMTIGAALLLGTSVGGELLNQGAPEYRSVSEVARSLGETSITGASIVGKALPLVLIQLLVATTLFWIMSLRAEKKQELKRKDAETDAKAVVSVSNDTVSAVEGGFKVNLFKAAVPLLPLVLLFLSAPPLQIFHVPHHWLVSPKEMSAFADPAKAAASAFTGRLIGAAMLIGVFVAALTCARTRPATDRQAKPNLTKAFFEGAGYALANIVAIIAAAACFGEGVKQLGLKDAMGAALNAWPALLLPMSGFLPLLFAIVSGSGIAATQILYPVLAAPAAHLQMDLTQLGSLVAVSAAAGRTMSPVSAIAVMCGDMTETRSVDLIKRVVIPLLISIGFVLLTTAAMRLGSGR